MNKSTKLYALYAAAVLAVGSAYLYFQHDDGLQRPEKGRVTITAKTTETTVVKTTVKSSKTTAVRKTKTTAAATAKQNKATETESSEPEILWIDINEADAEQFTKLPDIGEKLADEIIRYRNANGRFRNIEELMNVNGIGEGRFEAIREYIYVTNPVYDTEENAETSEEYESTQEETEHIITLDEVAPIDLNKAAKEELMLLPHVDETIAQRIIDFREQAGGYSHPYELLYIEGLTQNKVAEITEYVCVDKE